MINSQTPSNDDPHSSSETNNESLNDNSDNPKEEEEYPSNDPPDNSNKDRTSSIRDGKVPKPDDERKLFVGQLSSDINKEDLRKYFSKFGTIEDVTIKYDVPGGRARGFAFILFDQKESIEKVLHVQVHTINQCQIDPKPAHRRPPVTNPVKKIFIGQLPTDFVEQDLSDYFSQFGIIDTIELPMDREKSVRRPFGFVSFSSEKTAEEVLRQQRHSINGASIEVRPAKPRPSEQQHHQQQQQPFHQHQQQYQYGEYFLSHPHQNTLITTSTIPHQTSYYTQNTNNYQGQIEQWSQAVNNGGSYWNPTNTDGRNSSTNTNSISQWSTGTNPGLSTVSGNSSVYGTLGNSASSSSSVYPTQNQVQSIYHSNGINPQGQYPHSNYSNPLQTSAANVYGGAYPSSSQIIPANDLQPSSSSSTTWNQYAAANNTNQTTYDPNMYYAPYYPNLFAQQYYQQQQQLGNQSQNQVPIEQNYSPNGYSTSSNGGLDKTYQHLAR